MWTRGMTVTLLAATVSMPLAASAATFNYFARLNPLSGSGVSGGANLSLNTDANTLRVRVRAEGLAPNQLHVQHIHGTFGPDGKPSNAITPSFARGADSDNDGVIELAEGVPFYGPIILSLTDDTKPGTDGFPTAPNGKIDFSFTYDLANTPAFGSNLLTDDPDDTFKAADLMPLGFREIVLHGGFLDEGQGANGGEADGTPGFKTVLPVAAGEIAPVPLPAGVWLIGAAIGGLGLMGTRRRRGAA